MCSLEELSSKHYVAWVESYGTVKAYNLHAKVLKEAMGTEILSLYMVRKPAMELTGLSPQLVDMCSKSCMANIEKFKDDQFCTYIHDKHLGKCNELCYNKKGQPRAQMLYTPIAPTVLLSHCIKMKQCQKKCNIGITFYKRHYKGLSLIFLLLKTLTILTLFIIFRILIYFKGETDTAITIPSDVLCVLDVSRV